MIDIVKSLRRIAEEGYRFAGDAADEIERLRSRLEAAEKSDAESMAMYRRVRGERDALRAKIEAAEKERDNANAASVNIALEAERLQCENDALRAALQHEADCVEAAKAEIEALRAKIAEMERQEPVRHEFQGRDGDWYPFINQRHYENTVADGTWPIRALYALPGAQPAPSVPVAALRPVIQWLRNGCDPAKAADELEMLAAAPGSSRDDQHAGGLKALNHQGLMERARQNAKKEAGLIYPDDEARREEKEQELASEYYRQYTTPNP